MNEKKENITISKTSFWRGLTIVLALALVITLYTGVFSGKDSEVEIKNAKQPSLGAEPSPQGPAPTPSVNMDTVASDDPFKGEGDAPVTMVEFSDFECPFCGRFFRQTFPSIQEEYIDTGKVKFVYRDFPLAFHTNAQKAAEAAECAGEQGEYFAMHDKLFNNGVEGGVATFKQYASDLGLDTTEFNNCLDSGKLAAEVKEDMQDGAALGIQGTPGFIINGQLVSGAQPFSVFKQVIDAALANA